MRAAGVRSRIHAGRQREEAGKGGPKGEGRTREAQALGVPGPEEGPQHTQDIRVPEDLLLDGVGLAFAYARPRVEGQVQQEAEGPERQASPPDPPHRAGLAQKEPEKVRL